MQNQNNHHRQLRCVDTPDSEHQPLVQVPQAHGEQQHPLQTNEQSQVVAAALAQQLAEANEQALSSPVWAETARHYKSGHAGRQIHANVVTGDFSLNDHVVWASTNSTDRGATCHQSELSHLKDNPGDFIGSTLVVYLQIAGACVVIIPIAIAVMCFVFWLISVLLSSQSATPVRFAGPAVVQTVGASSLVADHLRDPTAQPTTRNRMADQTHSTPQGKGTNK